MAMARDRAPLDPAGINRLQQDTNGAAQVRIHNATGAGRSIRLEPGRLRLVGANPTARAAEFLQRYGSIFGVGDPATELSAPRERTDRLGMTHLGYEQYYRGIPVFAGVLKAHFDIAGRLILVQGTFIPGIEVDPNPYRTLSEAEAIAIGHVLELHKASAAQPLRAASTTLMVFRAGLAQRVEGRNHLVFEVEVVNGAGIREFVYVDAHTGKVVDRITGIHDALNRRIYEPAFQNVRIWAEGDPLPYDSGDPANDLQVNDLINVSEDVYDTFLNVSGGTFPSWDGDDSIMHTVWNIPPDGVCPNAFWDGVATNFCDGVAGDDTVAHEWSHAYTESTHNLIYQWQSGALNKSYSDIFGEIVDLLNGIGTDLPGPLRTDGECSAFGGSPAPALTINSPAAISGGYSTGGADFNPTVPITVTADVELVNDGSGNPARACQDPIGFTPGRIALLDRGGCAFTKKVERAQNAGAVGVIVANAVGDALIQMPGLNPLITIPSAFIGLSDGNLIKGELLTTSVNATIDHVPFADVSLRWLQGEDDPGFGLPIRDMWDPTCMGDPGKVTDTQYWCSTLDGGGVHTNSGIPNHAFALLTDGGTYNGRTVPAIGLTRATHIYWRAMEIYQAPDTDFADHADALEQSCADLIGVALPDLSTGAASGEVISATECAALAEAILAVELRTPADFCGFGILLDPNAPVPDCGSTIYSEDFESDPTASWALSDFGVAPEYIPRGWEWTSDVPEGGTGQAFFALDSLTLGNCTTDDQSGAMQLDSPPIVIPTDSVLMTFDHYVATEQSWDGGNIKISTNGGPFVWTDFGDFTFNRYNLRLATAAAGNTNPMEDQPSFTGKNGGENKGSWGQSHLSLDAYASAGDTIRLRFEFGVDGCNGLDGWYVDNVQLCSDCGGSGGADVDLDGSRLCDGDCDDADPTKYPGSPEVNDGLDNQCPGEPGFGVIDEMSGNSGFYTPGDTTEFSWTAQAGATLYQVARSTAADFSAGCTAFTPATPLINDTGTPGAGSVFYYLVRSLSPVTGSWGVDSAGVERLGICGL
jgi:Zn-dependent metalloprotease